MTLLLALSIFGILVLVLLSALCSGAESAFLSASWAKLHTLERKGDKRAAHVNSLKAHMEQVIGAILICNNLAIILSTSLATSVMIVMVGEGGVAFATALMTVIIVIFAEVVPKFYGMRRAEWFALRAVTPLRWILWVLGPLTRLFELFARAVLRLFGLKVNPGEALVSSMEELRGVIELHRGDAEALQERAMLRSVLDLGDVDVGEVMVHRKDVRMIDLDDAPEEIIDEVVASHHTRCPCQFPQSPYGTSHWGNSDL